MGSSSKPRETITGEVVRLNCERRNANGTTWRAGSLLTGDSNRVSFSCVGEFGVGDEITVVGEWTEHETYGRQFKGRSCLLCLPVNGPGLLRWLVRNVYSVGNVAARRLVDTFGTDLPELCATEPDRVAEDGNVAPAAVAAIAEAWKTNGNALAAKFWLMGKAGLTDRESDAALKAFGPTVVKVIQDDPFRLIGRAEGFGWKTTDELAARMGVTGTDRRRVRGALAAGVREAKSGDGWTCVPLKLAGARAAKKIEGLTGDDIADAVTAAVADGDVVTVGDENIATPEAARSEAYLWQALARSREQNLVGVSDEQAARALAEKHRYLTAQFKLEDEQVSGIVNALRFRVSCITGSAGTGKTQLTKAIIRAFGDIGTRVYLCAPTGKASRRITELVGAPASTIHRMLEFNGGTFQFGRNPLNPLEDGVILCDESSMCDSSLTAHIFAALGPRSAIVFIGDPNQLPPVGAGAPLRDILTHDLAPTTRLKMVHRQAGALKTNAVAILEGKVAESEPANDVGFSPWRVTADGNNPSEICRLVKWMYETGLPQWKLDVLRDAQFMAAQKTGPVGTRQLNLYLQHLHQTSLGNPLPEPVTTAHALAGDVPPEIHVGDKVIQTRNDYDLNVMNGETGIVLAKNIGLAEFIELTRGGITDDMDVPPDTHLVTPVLAAPEGGRMCLCPTCLSPRALAPGTGWSEELCGSCGVPFVASDGTPRPPAVRVPRRAKPMGESDIAYVVDFGDRTVPFPIGRGGDLQLSYVITTHKAQGSQFMCAITIVPSAHSFVHTRNWLYTSVTRAEKISVIIGDRAGILGAAQKTRQSDRHTILRLLAADPDANDTARELLGHKPRTDVPDPERVEAVAAAD